MTTITQLVDRVQLILNDTLAAVWAQTDVEEWIVDGIRDYSLHFPRVMSTTSTVLAGVRSYELPGDFVAALLIEFPATDDPPHHYLTRLARTHPQFWLGDGYYDIEATNANVDRPSTIYLSATPDGTEDLTITYSAFHIPAVNLSPPSDADISVPSYHEHLIEQYAIWQAHLERLSTEVQSPDTTIRLIQQYKLSVQATEASYRSSLRAAMGALSAGGWTGPWRVDNNDRIY